MTLVGQTHCGLVMMNIHACRIKKKKKKRKGTPVFTGGKRGGSGSTRNIPAVIPDSRIPSNNSAQRIDESELLAKKIVESAAVSNKLGGRPAS